MSPTLLRLPLKGPTGSLGCKFENYILSRACGIYRNAFGLSFIVLILGSLTHNLLPTIFVPLWFSAALVYILLYTCQPDTCPRLPATERLRQLRTCLELVTGISA